MFETAKRAGLQPHDLAKMLRVSRVTVSLWFNGHNKPHKLLTARVMKLLDAVDRAVECGELPAPHGLSREDRTKHIVKALAKQLANKADADQA